MTAKTWWALALPLLLLIVVAQLQQCQRRPPSLQAQDLPHQGKLAIVIVDSLRAETLDAQMPHLQAFSRRPDVRRLTLHTCAANFTLACLQTMFEGRQSPMAASLHNFTGQRGSSVSLPALATRAGHQLAIYSDHTMSSLYGDRARWLHNAEEEYYAKETDLLQADQAQLDRAREVLEHQPGLLVIHLIGTDKVAHFGGGPGSKTYNQHYRAVDTALAPILQQLQGQGYALLVCGDHGHDERGFHDRDSLALLQGFGPDLDALPLPDRLEQTELLYLMSIHMGLPLPTSYEGRYFLPKTPARASASLRTFLKRQHRLLRREGFDHDTLEGSVEAKQRTLDAMPARQLQSLASLAVVFFFWLLLLWQHSARAEPLRWRQHAVGLAAFAIALAGIWAGPANFAIAAALTLAGSIWAYRAGALRLLLWLLLPMIAAVVLAYMGHDYRDLFFVTKGQLNIERFGAFFGVTLILGAAASLARYASPQAAPEAAALWLILALPSGIYFYEFGQNILRPWLLCACLVGLLRLIQARSEPDSPRFWRDRSPQPLLDLGLLSTLLVILNLQYAAQHKWYILAEHYTEDRLPWLLWPAILALSIYLILQSPARKTMAALIALALGYAALTGLNLYRFLAALLVPACLLAYYRLAPTSWARDEIDTLADEREAIFVVVMALMAFFILLPGLTLANFDFQFTYSMLGWVDNEAQLAMLVGALTTPKYILPLLPLALLVACYSPRAWSVITLVVILLELKIAALLLQIHVGHLGNEAKLYELAAHNLVLLLGLTAIILSGCALLLLHGQIQRRLADKKEATP